MLRRVPATLCMWCKCWVELITLECLTTLYYICIVIAYNAVVYRQRRACMSTWNDWTHSFWTCHLLIGMWKKRVQTQFQWHAVTTIREGGKRECWVKAFGDCVKASQFPTLFQVFKKDRQSVCLMCQFPDWKIHIFFLQIWCARCYELSNYPFSTPDRGLSPVHLWLNRQLRTLIVPAFTHIG